VEDAREQIRALAAKSKRIAVHEVGVSASGRSIELVEIGNGPRAALLVGHHTPNEPVGCQTILTMIELLDQNPDLLAKLGFRWNCPSVSTRTVSRSTEDGSRPAYA